MSMAYWVLKGFHEAGWAITLELADSYARAAAAQPIAVDQPMRVRHWFLDHAAKMPPTEE